MANFQNIDFANNVGAVHALVQALGASVTWYGKRVVSLAPNSETYDLRALTKQFLDSINANFPSASFTLKDRQAGLKIREKLVTLYKETDDQIQNSCFLRISSFIFECFSWLFGQDRTSYQDFAGKSPRCLSVRDALGNDHTPIENSVDGRLLGFTEDILQHMFRNVDVKSKNSSEFQDVVLQYGDLIGKTDIYIVKQEKLLERAASS